MLRYHSPEGYQSICPLKSWDKARSETQCVNFLQHPLPYKILLDRINLQVDDPMNARDPNTDKVEPQLSTRWFRCNFLLMTDLSRGSQSTRLMADHWSLSTGGCSFLSLRQAIDWDIERPTITTNLLRISRPVCINQGIILVTHDYPTHDYYSILSMTVLSNETSWSTYFSNHCWPYGLLPRYWPIEPICIHYDPLLPMRSMSNLIFGCGYFYNMAMVLNQHESTPLWSMTYIYI